jgi:hypothetical protein
MLRTLQVLFRRDPSRDRRLNNVDMEGFQLLWPDRSPVGYGLDAFCYHAQRILSLNRFLVGHEERLLEMVQFPLRTKDDEMIRLPGLRVRRFLIRRLGPVGRIHLINGTATEITFEDGRDEPRVVEWIGLSGLRDGEQLWFDFTVRPAEVPWEIPVCVNGGGRQRRTFSAGS